VKAKEKSCEKSPKGEVKEEKRRKINYESPQRGSPVEADSEKSVESATFHNRFSRFRVEVKQKVKTASKTKFPFDSVIFHSLGLSRWTRGLFRVRSLSCLSDRWLRAGKNEFSALTSDSPWCDSNYAKRLEP
jgi:hypothetical protein